MSYFHSVGRLTPSDDCSKRCNTQAVMFARRLVRTHGTTLTPAAISALALKETRYELMAALEVVLIHL